MHILSLGAGMDKTPGAVDESAVPPELRAGRVVDTTVRIASLVQTTSSTVFAYVAQACSHQAAY